MKELKIKFLIDFDDKLIMQPLIMNNIPTLSYNSNGITIHKWIAPNDGFISPIREDQLYIWNCNDREDRNRLLNEIINKISDEIFSNKESDIQQCEECYVRNNEDQEWQEAIYYTTLPWSYIYRYVCKHDGVIQTYRYIKPYRRQGFTVYGNTYTWKEE